MGMPSIPQRDVGTVGDWTANVAIVGTMLNWLPSMAAGCAVLWFVLRAINFIRMNYFGKDSWKGLG